MDTVPDSTTHTESVRSNAIEAFRCSMIGDVGSDDVMISGVARCDWQSVWFISGQWSVEFSTDYGPLTTPSRSITFHQPRIHASRFPKFLVSSSFDHVASFEHDDFVAVANGAEPMGDDEA